MPGHNAGSSLSAGDEEAFEFLASLTLAERHGVVALMDQRMGFRESSFKTDDDVDDYIADMMVDLHSGPLTGAGRELIQSLPRDVIRRLGSARMAPGSSGSTRPGANRPNTTPRNTDRPTINRTRPVAGMNSLDYSRFEDVDTSDEEPSEDEFDSDAAESGSRLALDWVRGLSLDELRNIRPQPDLDDSDETWERIRSNMIASIENRSIGNAPNTTSSRTARSLSIPSSSASEADEEVTADDFVFLIKDDAEFRRRVIDIRRDEPCPPRFVTADEARTERNTRVQAIFEDHRQLEGILERHEATIQKRWAKKTKAQRLKVLLAAWPGMSAKHRPDLHAVKRAIRTDGRVVYSESDREAYLWPHINQEDLVKPRVLPTFLHARGYNLPYIFWRFDAASTDLAHKIGLRNEAWLNRHHMLFRDRKTPETYGELVECHSDKEAFGMMKDRSLPPGSGLEVLEIQQRILCFLVDCCQEILHDVPPERLLAHPMLPVPHPTETGTQAITSLAEIALEGPYGAPNGIDILGLRTLFTAKRSAAEDHIYGLREDPSYFVDTLRDAMDHRYEHVKDNSGSLHPNLRAGKDGLIWGSVVSNVVASGEYSLDVWTQLCEVIGDVEKELNELDGEVPQGPLPKKLRFNLSYLKTCLEYAIRGSVALLKSSFYSSPPMRPYVTREEHDAPRSRKTGMGNVSLKNSSTVKLFVSEGTPETQLCWLVDLLTTEDKNGELCARQWGLTIIVDELGRLLQNESRAKAFVSSRVAEIISSLGVLSEALRQMIGYDGQLFYCPVTPLHDYKGNRLTGIVLQYYNLLEDIEGSRPEEFYKLCVPPTDGRFHYPSEKRRSKENHEAMRAAEKNLDAFWRKVDANLEVRRQWQLEHLKKCSQCCDCHLDTAMSKLLKQPRYIQRLGEWIEYGGTSAEHETQQRKADEAARRPLSEMYFDLERRTERTVAKPHTHKHNHDHGHGHSHSHGHGHRHHGDAKPKTRGKPITEKENTPRPAAILPPSEQKDEQPVFEVDARAHKVFKTIFFNPSISSTPGEVPWLDFVHAMCTTGFQAEKLYGSVWQFKPTRLDVERAILIHEPHPSGKIPYRVCRNHGRRLNRAYGWTGDNFVLAGRGAAGG